MAKNKIAVIVGSNRKGSINRQLAGALIALGHDSLDAEIVPIDELPMYNQDLEADLPDSVSRFKAALAAADGILFVTPEHSRSIPAVLKNALDWGARPWGKNSWTGKVAAVTGATPGAISTALAQQHLRQILGAQGVTLTGGEAYIQFKPELIGANGDIADESARTFLAGFLDQFASLVSRLAPAAKAAA
ncbi:MAG: NADPH-dependent FMN reductase [Pseudolabrys sp.]